jgi:hypothetical protein
VFDSRQEQGFHPIRNEAFPQGKKRQESESDHSLLSSGTVNAWNCISHYSYVLMM